MTLELANFSKTGEVWPLQADCEQQCAFMTDFTEDIIVLHRKHLSHILLFLQICDCSPFLVQ